MVVVTPHLVSPLPPDVRVALPTDRGPLTNEEIRTKANPFEATRPRIPAFPESRSLRRRYRNGFRTPWRGIDDPILGERSEWTLAS